MDTVFIVGIVLVVIAGVVIYINKINNNVIEDEEEYSQDKTA